MKAVVALAGEIQDTALLRERVAGAGLIIAADSGAARLLECGIRPHTVIGDFDSLAGEALEDLREAGVEVASHPAPQEKTDGHVALLLAQERGATEIVLLGAHGGERLDHSLNNLLFAVSVGFGQTPITIIDGWTEGAGLRGDGRRRVRFRGEAGDYVSLIPLSEPVRGIATEGLRWPVRDGEMWLGRAQGLSNELIGSEGGFEIAEGVAYATHHFRQRRLL